MKHDITSETALFNQSNNLELHQTRLTYVVPKLEMYDKYKLLTCGISAGLGLNDPTNLEQNQ